MKVADRGKMLEDDLLWQHLKSVPAFRALLRSVEARLLQQIELPSPVLDMGCGDGHFARTAFRGKLAAGIDPWWRPLSKASRFHSHKSLIQGFGNELPFADGSFATDGTFMLTNTTAYAQVRIHIGALESYLY